VRLRFVGLSGQLAEMGMGRVTGLNLAPPNGEKPAVVEVHVGLVSQEMRVGALRAPLQPGTRVEGTIEWDRSSLLRWILRGAPRNGAL
jgi:hypothetical protein